MHEILYTTQLTFFMINLTLIFSDAKINVLDAKLFSCMWGKPGFPLE
jgi:hypothetical protein